jgi:kinesin family protein 2/24
VYLETVKPLIQSAFAKSAKVTCFAYGQTGSGKTYTTLGDASGAKTTKGLYALAAQDIFTLIRNVENLTLLED